VSTDSRADRQIVEHAAAALHSRTAQDVYVGLSHPAVCYSMCLVLDELVLHWRDVDEEVRRQAVQTCRALIAAR
jgi:hypothetical protein